MIGFPPVNDTGYWSSPEIHEAYTNVTFPLAIVSLIVNVVGVVITYSFRKTRKFPASVLGWNGLFNIYACAYAIIKWSPDSITNFYLVHNPTPSVCSVSLFADLSIYYANVACNTVIALTLYFTVYKRWSLEYRDHPRYFWCFVFGIWSWFLFIPVLVATRPKQIGSPFCAAVAPYVYVYSVPTLFMITVQLGLVGRSLHAAFDVIKAASSLHEKKDIRKAYLVVRFGATFFSQLLAILPYFILQLHLATSTERTRPEMFKTLMVGPPLAYLIDGMILILMNKSFTHWITLHVAGDTSSDSSSDDSKKRNTAKSSVDLASRTNPSSTSAV
jgi:hypothetical protein